MTDVYLGTSNFDWHQDLRNLFLLFPCMDLSTVQVVEL